MNFRIQRGKSTERLHSLPLTRNPQLLVNLEPFFIIIFISTIGRTKRVSGRGRDYHRSVIIPEDANIIINIQFNAHVTDIESH